MKRSLKPSEVDKLLDTLDIQPILKDKVMQVRWLYNNSNKCTKVYEEKLVRLIVHKLSEEIKFLRSRFETTTPDNKQKTNL